MTRLIVYNIEYCIGLTGRKLDYLKFWKTFRSPKKLDEKIINNLHKYNPDILALVEVDSGSIRSGKDEAAYFRKKLGMKYSIEKVKYPNKGWLKILTHTPILDKQSNAIITKNKPKKVKYHLLKEGTKRVVIECTLKIKNKDITLLLAHLALSEKARKLQFTELSHIINSIKNPVILMGDFNTFKGNREITPLLKKTHLENKYKLNKNNIKNTYPAFNPKVKLDYVLTSKKIKINSYKPLDFQFSDHLPLMVDFNIK